MKRQILPHRSFSTSPPKKKKKKRKKERNKQTKKQRLNFTWALLSTFSPETVRRRCITRKVLSTPNLLRRKMAYTVLTPLPPPPPARYTSHNPHPPTREITATQFLLSRE